MKRRYPWIAQQSWQDVLFIHTPVSPQNLRRFVPAPFKIDTYDGSGWMSLVIFRATNSRLRYMPKWLSYPPFYQMNMRTYVRFGNERGVYFFSLNTNSRLVSAGGRAVSLPFRQVPMMIRKENDRLLFRGDPLPVGQKGMLQGTYQPYSTVFEPKIDSLSHFLTERYCIWMIRNNHTVKVPINHKQWRLQQAYTTIQENQNIHFTNDTFSHYCDYLHSVVYPFENIGIIS